MENKNQCRQCAVCGKSFPLKDLVSGEVIRNVISDEILKDHQIEVTQALFVGPIWQIIELNMCSPYYARKRVSYLT